MSVAKKCCVAWALVVGAGLAIAPLTHAADSKKDASAGAKSVDLFDAMQNGDIEVKYIPHDSRQAQMIVKNNTDQPLTVKLPEAFAATPVLAQAAGGNNRTNRTNRNNNNNNQNQSTGGGFNGGGGGGIGGNRGGGQFSIPPEKTVTVKAETVCLEHGKASPNAHVPYEIKPIDSYTDDPKVQELCKLLGKGEASQKAIQAAAWHFANHMTWEELTAKKIHHLGAADEQYFSADDIRLAMKVADVAIKAAEKRGDTPAAASDKPSSTTEQSSGR